MAARLTAHGWTILGRRVRVGRLELDIVATDPGPPGRLVAVEVRWRAARSHGLAEETIDGRKRGRLRRAIVELAVRRSLPDGSPIPCSPVAVDLIVVEPGISAADPPRIRHHRDVLA